MSDRAVVPTRRSRWRGGRREIGPLGTASRMVGGVIAIALGLAGGIGWWDLALALIVLPWVGAAAAPIVSAGSERVTSGRRADRRLMYWSGSGLALVVMIAVGVALTYVTPANGSGAVWTFLGVSMLVAALRGDAACEVVALANALSGRRSQLGCILYGPIDMAEGRWNGHGQAPGAAQQKGPRPRMR